MQYKLHTADATTLPTPPPFALTYMDPPFATGFRRTTTTSNLFYPDPPKNPDEYVRWLRPYLKYAQRNTFGNVVIHIDPRMSHYVKVEMDSLFGQDNFRNEIIWSYASGGAPQRKLASKHDTLLWYTTSIDYAFNIHREPYATPDVQDRPGFHPDGRMLTDVWNISIMATTSKERTGYPTQKPLPLLERLVTVLSDPHDWVADPFMGSGTTGVAALRNQRNFYGCDINPEAVKIATKRMEEEEREA